MDLRGLIASKAGHAVDVGTFGIKSDVSVYIYFSNGELILEARNPLTNDVHEILDIQLDTSGVIEHEAAIKRFEQQEKDLDKISLWRCDACGTEDVISFGTGTWDFNEQVWVASGDVECQDCGSVDVTGYTARQLQTEDVND